jgi:putative ABC transport system permease protein
MGTFVRDLKLALRNLLSRPAYTGIVVGTLALGIGANAAVFSMVDALVLHPFPIPDIDRLVMLWETVPQINEDRASVSPANFLDWKEQSTKFDDLVAFEWWDVNLTGIGEPELLQGTHVSPGFLDDLGVKTILGRTLAADRQSFGAKTVVLGYQFYARRFGSDPTVLGKSIVLDGEKYTVVGVAQPDFDYPDGSDLWAPLWFDAKTAAVRDHYYLDVIGKLKPGVEANDVEAELDVIGKRLAREHPATNEGRGVRALSLQRAVVDLGSPTFLALWQSASVFVLLIACVNIANLLLARGADREKEISLQQALGAGRARIVRQLLTENLLMAMVGAAVALPLAWVGIDLLRGGLPPEIQRFVVGWRQIGLDFRVLAFTGIVTLLTTLLFGLVPALRASRSDLAATLKEGGRAGSDGAGRQRARSLLVVGEVALALMLLVASGLSIRGTLRLANGDQGYDPYRVMTFEISLPERKYAEDEKKLQFYRSVVEGVSGISGVVSADLANVVPSSGANRTGSIEVEGQKVQNLSERPRADYRIITPGFLGTLRIPLLRGRALDDGDRKDTMPVAVVSRKFAERMWPGADALGKRFRSAGADDVPWVTVVGVAGDVLHDWFLKGPQPTFYEPMEQQPQLRMRLVVRTAGDPEAVTAAVRAQILRADPDQPVFNVHTQRELILERIVGLSYVAIVMAITGLIGLVLSAVGIYGLMAYSVSRRTREIGLRVALGAEQSDVLRLTVGQAFRVTLVGVGAGLVLAYGAGRLMVSTLFGVVRLDVWTYVTLALVLTVVSLMAGYFPARRAISVDPAVALRTE